ATSPTASTPFALTGLLLARLSGFGVFPLGSVAAFSTRARTAVAIAAVPTFAGLRQALATGRLAVWGGTLGGGAFAPIPIVQHIPERVVFAGRAGRLPLGLGRRLVVVFETGFVGR